jgi:hypothetical protein
MRKLLPPSCCVIFLLLLGFRTAQIFTVTGTIHDDKGNPVAFASVIEKGTHNGVSADVNGLFRIKLKSDKTTIVISAVGFNSKEIKVKGKAVIDVTLIPSRMELQEVVVTTKYEVKRKASVTGAATTVKNSNITGNVLQGNVAGMIRGISTSGSSATINQWGTGTKGYAGDFNTEEYDHISEKCFS